MKNKRFKVGNKYKVSLLPEKVSETDIELGIPVEVFSIFDLDLEKVDEILNDLYSSYLVAHQDTPSQDTLNSMLRIAFLRLIVEKNNG